MVLKINNHYRSPKIVVSISLRFNTSRIAYIHLQRVESIKSLVRKIKTDFEASDFTTFITDQFKTCALVQEIFGANFCCWLPCDNTLDFSERRKKTDNCQNCKIILQCYMSFLRRFGYYENSESNFHMIISMITRSLTIS